MDKIRDYAKRYRADWVTITLEGSDEKFSVPKALLCKITDYFLHSLNEACVEAESQTLNLSDCDLETFQAFLYWTSHQELPDMGSELQGRVCDADADLEAKRVAHQTLLIRLWVFGDKCTIPALQNSAMDSLLDLLVDYRVYSEALRLAFEQARHDSELCNALVKETYRDSYSRFYSEEEMQELASIPGFYSASMEAAREYGDAESWGGDQTKAPSGQDDRAEYMVAE